MSVFTNRRKSDIIEKHQKKMVSRGRKTFVDHKTQSSGLGLPKISPSKKSKEILNNFYPKSLKLNRLKLASQASHTSTRSNYKSGIPPNSKQLKTMRAKKFIEDEEEEVFTINTKHSKLERYTLKDICLQNEWKEVKHTISGSLMWYIGPLRDIDIKILAYKKCYFNRYPKSNLICRKSRFHSIMRKYTRFFPDQFNFIPNTFILPDEFRQFCRTFNSNRERVYLAKPSMSKGGEGIFFVKSKRDVAKDPSKPTSLVVQEYIQNPLLLGKKFDLRIYLLVKGVKNLEAFVAMEGMARFCTEDYTDPLDALSNEEESKTNSLFSHLTNFTLNKENEKFKTSKDFKTKDEGSKRLLSTVLKSLKKEGADVESIKNQIRDIATKIVIAFQPFLVNTYHTEVGIEGESNQNCFHIFGFDILIDDNSKCWLMEVNSQPSMSYVQEQVVTDENGMPRTQKIPSEIDKYLKNVILKEALDLVIDKDLCNMKSFKTAANRGSKEGPVYVFEKVFPPSDTKKYSKFMIYNEIRVLFELLAGYKKPDNLTISQFQKLCNYPGMKKDTFKKPDYTMLYQSCKKRLSKNEMTLDGFTTALEHLACHIYPEVDSSYERLKTLVAHVISYASR
ncbi:unnamed protein product [Moneuplotes crassus]|uniref:Tubulin-tyrosine ligase family protein n=1 Tax=Euplotes crassus TaxID=5936 RepID=A0AAD1U9R7_EUPCR|nr:unnamed protein product [Moneuplotes crassus]